MLCKLPKHTPPLGVMLADLGNPHPHELARALHVGERTVRRWLAINQAPRPALLSVFWLNVDLYNTMRVHAATADALRRQLACVAPDVQTAALLPEPPPLLYAVR